MEDSKNSKESLPITKAIGNKNKEKDPPVGEASREIIRNTGDDIKSSRPDADAATG